MVSIRAHNLADYALGAAFIAAPFAFGFNHVYFAQDVFLVLGVAVIGYSLLTDYAYSVSKAIPMSMHMTFDVVCGIFAVLAPWIYGYREELSALQFVMHWVLGLAAVALPMVTDSAHRASASKPIPLPAPASDSLRGVRETGELRGQGIDSFESDRPMIDERRDRNRDQRAA